jgi:hypothetical protein
MNMNKSMFREIKDGEDVTDIVAKIIAFMAIPVAVVMIAIALWTIFMTPGNACGPGIC